MTNEQEVDQTQDANNSNGNMFPETQSMHLDSLQSSAIKQQSLQN